MTRMTSPTLPPLRAKRAPSVPNFLLYGETSGSADGEFVHIEDIACRSHLYAWEIQTHAHRGLFQTVVVLEGGGRVHLDDRTESPDAPFAVTIPPAVAHAFQFLPDTRGFVLTMAEAMLFDGSRQPLRSLFEHLFVEARVTALAPGPEGIGRIAPLLDQIMLEMRWPAPGRDAMVECLVRAVLLFLERQQTPVSRALPHARGHADLFQRFRLLVEEHLAEHWTIPRYAATLGLTETRLNRLCRSLAGKSAFDMVQERLLVEARRRLVYIEAPVALLAYELGFQDPAYFCRFFKKMTGMTPTSFRHRRRRDVMGESAPRS